jgi:type I restriction enzyme S subunit
VTKSTKLETIVSIFNKKDLPGNWLLKSIGEICLPVQKVNPKENPDNEFNYIDISGIDNEKFRIARTKKYSGKEAPSRARQLVKSGDIVFSTVRTYLKNIAIVPPKYHGQIASTGFCVLRPVFPKYGSYLYYYLQYELFLNELAKFQRGTSYPAVRNSDVFDQFIPVPPENESACIVAEIEKQFSRLDEAVENLKRVKANLKRYKASVLKAAVEGKLTEEWRAKNKDVEPADKLLQRILAERRRKWEESELAKMRTAGKKPKDDKWKKKYKEAVKPSGEDLTQIHINDIPDSWVFCSADQLTTVVTDGEHITPTRSNKGIFLLSARNIQDGWISFEKVDYISKDVHEKLKRRLTINEDDVLMSCSGSVGRSCVAPKKPEFSLVRSVAALKPVIENGKFMSYSIRSTLLQSQINTKKTQTAQANIFQGKIRTLIFTLPPIQEQDEIIIQVEEKLSVADKFEFVVDNALKRAERLRQSILKKAFSGELVAQNSNDEPADALLNIAGK